MFLKTLRNGANNLFNAEFNSIEKEKELIKREIKFNKTINKLNLLIKETSSALAL